MLKKVTRFVKNNLYYLLILIIGLLFLLFGQKPYGMIIYVISILINLFAPSIFMKLKAKIETTKLLHECLSATKEYKLAHRIRYIAYLHGDLEIAEEMDAAMKEGEQGLLDSLKYAIENVKQQKQKKMLQEAIEELEYMIKNAQPKQL